MNNSKAQKILNKLIQEVQNEFDTQSVCNQLSELRTIALEIEDPLIVKTLRLMREKLEEDKSFEIELEFEDEEDAEEYEVPENQLAHLLLLILESDNKYNREEIKLFRTALMKELY